MNVGLVGQQRKNDVTLQLQMKILLEEGILHLLANTGKMTSNSSFKERFSESFLDPVRGFQLEFDMIWEVQLPCVLIYSKIRHCKAMNIGLAGQRQKNGVTQQLQSKIF